MQDSPTDTKPGVETFALNTSGGSVGGEIERVCTENEWIISTWSPIHLRTKLKELYWKGSQNTAKASAFFEDTLRYLYLPRLRARDVLVQAIRAGAASKDFFGTAYGEADGKFEGFSLGTGNVIVDDTLLLIEPQAAETYAEATRPVAIPASSTGGASISGGAAEGPSSFNISGASRPPEAGKPSSVMIAGKPKTFHGSAEVPPATAKMRLVQIAEEIISVLTSDPNATVRVVVEISAEFPEGVQDGVKRAVSENARALGLKSADWE